MDSTSQATIQIYRSNFKISNVQGTHCCSFSHINRAEIHLELYHLNGWVVRAVKIYLKPSPTVQIQLQDINVFFLFFGGGGLLNPTKIEKRSTLVVDTGAVGKDSIRIQILCHAGFVYPRYRIVSFSKKFADFKLCTQDVGGGERTVRYGKLTARTCGIVFPYRTVPAAEKYVLPDRETRVN
jgi:hypothetical protein